MLHIGSYNELEVARKVDFGIYLSSADGESVLLPRKYVPTNAEIGSCLRVFVYTDSEDRPVATTRKPKATVDEFAYLKVKAVSGVGAFLDWGLEKDLLVPFRLQHQEMTAGQSYVVRVFLDEKSGRVVASSRLRAFFSQDVQELEAGQQVSLMVYDFTDLGIKVIVDGKYSGVIYRNELFEPLHLGDVRNGYVKKVREDNGLDITLQKQGFEAVTDLKPVILQRLQDAGGFLPCHGKSDAADIQKTFRMSKKLFKKVIGGLYKDGLISISDDGIRLANKPGQ